MDSPNHISGWMGPGTNSDSLTNTARSGYIGLQDHGADRRFKNIRLEAAMKITNLEVLLTGTAWRNFLFVKLSTDEGLVGWGDGTLEWKETAVRDLIPDFGRRYVVGANPFGIEGRELSREQLK